ncbi:MAG: hypothetical protein AAF721_39245 [Myxococcota bacterium]
MNAGDVARLRKRLRMNRSHFAKLCGVDARTVTRWETTDGPRPTGAAAAVMTAIQEKLDGDPKGAARVIKFLAGAAALGGLAYVLLKLLGNVDSKENE